jgi:fluoroquinolone transport system permease protein
MVTPVGKRGYLASRLLLPALFASLAGLAVLPLFGLSGLSAAEILCLSPAMGVIAVIASLLVTSISGNRIEGMAVGKLSGLVLCGIVVPFVATGNIRFSFAFLPTFWVAEFFVHRPFYAIPAFIATSALWIAFLYSRFERKTLSSVG